MRNFGRYLVENCHNVTQPLRPMHSVPQIFKTTDLGSQSEVEEEKLPPVAHAKKKPYSSPHTDLHTQVVKYSESTTTTSKR